MGKSSRDTLYIGSQKLNHKIDRDCMCMYVAYAMLTKITIEIWVKKKIYSI